uniref:SGNH/GDSL hydrolase family protein n=1 Tax=uncultured Draconibacterium sp. TaxID=1573823 RepID=UPI00321685F7
MANQTKELSTVGLIEAKAIELLRLHNPNLSFQGFADAATATPAHAANNAWIITESGTVFGVAGCVKGQVIYSDGAAFVVERMSLFSYFKIDHTSNLTNGFLDSQGNIVLSANWRCKQVDFKGKGIFYYQGYTYGTSAYGAMAFDENDNVIETLVAQVSSNDSEIEFTTPENTAYIIASSRFTGDTFAIKQMVTRQGWIEELISLREKSEVIALKTITEDYDFTDKVSDYYLSSLGELVASGGSWQTTELIEVEPGKVLKYKGKTQSSGYPIAAYDSNGDFVSQLLTRGDYNSYQEITIPSGVSYVRCCSIVSGVDYFETLYDRVNFVSKDQISALIAKEAGELGILTETEIETKFGLSPYFLPPVGYAYSGEYTYLNPWGIISKYPKTIDVVFDLPYCNESYGRYAPGAENEKSVGVKYRNKWGELEQTGTITIKNTHTVQSPATAQNFIHLGDSTVQCISAANIEGAVINEVSRRLTGVGTNILPASAPVALSLSNLHFRGTLGDQAIKHEGRGGWSLYNYLYNASVSSVSNAFWNPTPGEFDIDYYLTQNNFYSAQTLGGVDATGSNLTMIIQLGWNHVYKHTIAEAGGWLIEMIDSLKAKLADIKIVLVGLNCVPYPLNKSFSDTRDVSFESIMRKAIVPFSNEWQRIADLYNNVEFLSIAPFMMPDYAYGYQNIAKHTRTAETETVYNDYVHPNAVGYAQMADIITKCLLYNYCRLS